MNNLYLVYMNKYACMWIGRSCCDCLVVVVVCMGEGRKDGIILYRCMRSDFVQGRRNDGGKKGKKFSFTAK